MAVRKEVRAARGRGSRSSGRAGFTLLEVTLAVTVLLVAVLAAAASTLRMHALRRTNRERTIAQNAVRSVSERLQSLSARAVTDPAGWSTTVLMGVAAAGEIGPRFDVRELTAREGAPSVGTVTIVTDENANDAALGAELGLPRDLDGDGTSANGDVSANALLLPVVVRARWHGVNGDGEIVHSFYLSRF